MKIAVTVKKHYEIRFNIKRYSLECGELDYGHYNNKAVDTLEEAIVLLEEAKATRGWETWEIVAEVYIYSSNN